MHVLPGLCSLPEKLFQALGQPENLQFEPQLFVAGEILNYLEIFSFQSGIPPVAPNQPNKHTEIRSIVWCMGAELKPLVETFS